MAIVDFSQYYYYPALLSGKAEHEGFQHLSKEDKDSVLPILEISNQLHASSFEASLELIEKTSESRPFLLDLCPEPAPDPWCPKDPDSDETIKWREQCASQQSYNEELRRVTDPVDGFLTWRTLAARFPNAIPVLQYTDASTQAKSLLRQAARLGSGGASLAIRVSIDSSPAIYPIIGQIYSILDGPEKLLIIVDCGQGRRNIEERASKAQGVMAAVGEEVDRTSRQAIQAVLISNSFTKPSYNIGAVTTYENYDSTLWNIAREAFDFSCGDYAGVYRAPRPSTYVPSDWVPTICYPLDTAWLLYRHPNSNDSAGWSQGANAIASDSRFHPPVDAWGVQLIERAARGDTAGADRTRFWTAAKVNIHIHRQIRQAANIVSSSSESSE